MVGSPAPDFRLPALRRGDADVEWLSLADFRGAWLALTFYPSDFSELCPVELLAMSDRIAEYDDLRTRILGISSDSLDSHREFLRTPRQENGVEGLAFPLASDPDHAVARAYGVVSPLGLFLRGLYLVDPDGVVQYAVIHQLNIGRSVDEILRVIEALQTGGLCSGRFQRGQKVADLGPLPSRLTDLVNEKRGSIFEDRPSSGFSVP